MDCFKPNFITGISEIYISAEIGINHNGSLDIAKKLIDIAVDAVTTSEISVAMTVNQAVLENRSLIEKLSVLGKVKAEDNFCLISVIGNKINQTPGVANKIFDSCSISVTLKSVPFTSSKPVPTNSSK